MKKNAFYFIKKHGGKTFKEFPFNEVDSLILSQLSYFNFTDYAPSINEKKDPITLNEIISDDFVLYKICQNTLDEKLNRKLLNALKTSRRYAELKVGYIDDKFVESRSEQFYGITFVFNDFAYVAFRGTDPSLIGWKEDFEMSFMDSVVAQNEAKQYLESVAKLVNPLSLIVGGHSKGGNLTYYSVVKVDRSLHPRIIKIYNHDGPGFKSADIFHSENYLDLESKMVKMMPDDAMIGILMHHSWNYQVIKCYGFSILKHDLFNWQVTKDGHLKTIKHLFYHAHVFDKIVNEWINSIEEEERKKLVLTLFDLIGANSNISVLDIKHHPIVFYKTFRRRYKALPEERKEFIRCCLRKYKEISKRIYNEQKHLKKIVN